jgi:hypothetical protein
VSSMNESFSPNADEVAFETVDGEAILINLSTGIYYSIDGIGSLVWSAIENGFSLLEVCQSVSTTYNRDTDEVNAHIATFVDQLLAENLVISGESRKSSTAFSIDQQTTLEYKAPELVIYSDMGDLLALDPPLPGLNDIPWKGENG